MVIDLSCDEITKTIKTNDERIYVCLESLLAKDGKSFGGRMGSTEKSLPIVRRRPA
jgi:hypothetical protein